MAWLLGRKIMQTRLPSRPPCQQAQAIASATRTDVKLAPCYDTETPHLYLFHFAPSREDAPMTANLAPAASPQSSAPLYQQVAGHYRQAISVGT
ncbi:MAG TPA: 2-aminoadipate aminotransferase, partial [Cupriavidus sp.]|nr:2-aminoadipate aminotransferase [Cupriavidus sp.]